MDKLEKELKKNRESCHEKAQELSVKRSSCNEKAQELSVKRSSVKSAVKGVVKTTVSTPSRNLRRFGHQSATTSMEPKNK